MKVGLQTALCGASEPKQSKEGVCEAHQHEVLEPEWG